MTAPYEPDADPYRVTARPASEDSRVEKLAQYLGESGWSLTASRTKATVKIRDMEYAKLLVLDPSSEALVERICEALDRHQYAGMQHVHRTIRSWDELSERTHRLRHNQFIDAARAVLAALAAPGGEPT